MKILTLKIKANRFDAFRDTVNAVVPDTIGEPVPVTNNENAPATHYLVDLPATPEVEQAIEDNLPGQSERWVRRGVERDENGNPLKPTTRGFGEIMAADGLRRLPSQTS